MNRQDWKILYSSAAGVEERALEFLYGEMGNRILRDPGVYSLYTLCCETAGDQLPESNAVIIGTWQSNPLIRKFIDRQEIPGRGFRVRIRKNPAHPEKQLVLIAGASPCEVLYGVIAFLDDLLPPLLPVDADGILYDSDAFRVPFPEFDYADAPATAVRSVFTWAHPIGNFEEYFRNMARLKFNRVYLWNEFPPVNAREVVEYAHSWGIEIFWGFSWGWSTRCTAADVLNLDAMSAEILREWHESWSKLPGDGIYFQSFTETTATEIAGRNIAECVSKLVNHTAHQILTENPRLKIVYGLHATSVQEQLAIIAQTDPRLEILWENCGGFPYKINEPIQPEQDHAFTRVLLAQGHAMGLVYKCQLMQKWTDFVHQAGPYILGRNGRLMQAHDITLTDAMWRRYEALWAEHGTLAWELARLVQREGGAAVELNLAAQLNGPVHWPTALTAELFWNSEQAYSEIRARILRRNWIIH